MASHLPTVNVSNPDLSEAVSLFKQKCRQTAKQARKICRGSGDKGLKWLNANGLSEDEKKVHTNLWNFYEGQLKLNVNFRNHRLHPMHYRQKPDMIIDDFVTRARTLAQKCQFIIYLCQTSMNV